MKSLNRLAAASCAAALAVFASGCGNDAALETVPISGKVYCNGELVTAGTLTFSPRGSATGDSTYPGKPANAVIGSDGSYSASTYSSGDGVIPGSHSVTLNPPDVEVDSPDDDPTAEAPCANEKVQIEVTGANSSLDIRFGEPEA